MAHEEETPLPTAPNPAPPEGVPDEAEALAVGVAPDAVRTPVGSSTPVIFYQVYGRAGDEGAYSPDVFYNGKRAMRFNSHQTRTYGAEPGTALGVKSNTVNGIIWPTSHSPIVNINGSPAIRDRDRCELNNGNLPGEYRFYKSSETQKAPEVEDQTDEEEDQVDQPGQDQEEPAAPETPKESKGAWGSFKDQFMDKSGTAQGAVQAYDKAGQYWNDPGSIATDAKSVWDGLPSGEDLWNGGKALYEAATWENMKKLPGATWDKGVETAGAAKQVYDTDGFAGILGAGVGVGLDLVNPLKKARMAMRGAEALDDLGHAAKAAKRLEDAKKPGHKPGHKPDHKPDDKSGKKPNPQEQDGDGGVRVTEKPKRRKNPCLHLAKGNPNGKGPYRGGSYGGTKGVGHLDMESNHMPPNSVSPLSEGTSPAMAMDKRDHRIAMSTGSSDAADDWRAKQQDLISQGRHRDATAMDYRNVREIAREQGDPRKYNEGLRETSAYRKCLEKHGLLPGKTK